MAESEIESDTSPKFNSSLLGFCRSLFRGEGIAKFFNVFKALSLGKATEFAPFLDHDPVTSLRRQEPPNKKKPRNGIPPKFSAK